MNKITKVIDNTLLLLKDVGYKLFFTYHNESEPYHTQGFD